MIYRALATVLLVFHFAFVLFVVLGGLLVARWARVAWIHIPAALWGVLIEYAGWICPLTPLENALRAKGGEAGYAGGFIEHYILRALYPGGLTRGIQVVLGTAVLVLNVLAYGVFLRRTSHQWRI